MTRVLAGDVGGTSTRLAVFELRRGALTSLARERFPSRRHRGLEEIAVRFLDAHGGGCAAACFGVAGPVRGEAARTTNLPWEVASAALSRATGIPAVGLLNDLEATAWGIDLLPADGLRVLARGTPEPGGNRAVIAAGTGLGEAGLVWDGERYRAVPTEGGHADFAPGSELEIDLLRHLRDLYGHVSWERVLSGPGLVELARFFFRRRGEEPPEHLRAGVGGGDAAAAVTRAAAEPAGPCREAVELFVRLYGAEAGNLALKLGATGGVLVAGGIAPQIRGELTGGAFLEAFRAKGRMRPLLEAIPLTLVLDVGAPLLGAARCAVRLAGGSDPSPPVP